MKIRKRITYTYTGIFGILMLALCLLVYFMTSAAQEQLFFNQLNDRLEITEKFFLKSDSLPKNIKQKVRNNFLKMLPQEMEYVAPIAAFSPPQNILKNIPQGFISELSLKTPFTWKKNNKQGVARLYEYNNITYIVLVIAVDEFGQTSLSRLKTTLLLSCLIAVILTFLLSDFFSRKVLKPIAGKIKKANNISASNLDERLTVYNQNDELGMLAQSFNDLLDRLQKAFELEKNFVRYASHEIKNPLAVILGEAEVALMQERTVNEYVATIEKIKSKAEKLNMLVEYFLQLSKLESFQITKQKINVDEVLIEISFNLSQHYQNIDIIFNVEGEGESDDFVLYGDPQLIYNALYNLIENACKFSENEAKVLIDLMRSKENNKTIISIKDQGIGIAPAEIELIYKPMYRGGNALNKEGTGIGLALVKRIIELHGGEILVTSALGKGTEFKVLI